MLNGYHRSFNVHAVGQVARGVDVPDAALGIGFAEATRSVPLAFDYGSQKPPVVEKITSIDQASIDGQGAPLTLSQFSNTGWVGDQLWTS